MKTDAWDARHMARLLHTGQIVAVTVPDAATQAARIWSGPGGRALGSDLGRHRVSKAAATLRATSAPGTGCRRPRRDGPGSAGGRQGGAGQLDAGHVRARHRPRRDFMRSSNLTPLPPADASCTSPATPYPRQRQKPQPPNPFGRTNEAPGRDACKLSRSRRAATLLYEATRTTTRQPSSSCAMPCYARVRGGRCGGDPSMACKGSGVQIPSAPPGTTHRQDSRAGPSVSRLSASHHLSLQ